MASIALERYCKQCGMNGLCDKRNPLRGLCQHPDREAILKSREEGKEIWQKSLKIG